MHKFQKVVARNDCVPMHRFSLTFTMLLYTGQKKQKCQVSLLLQFVVDISIKWLAYCVCWRTAMDWHRRTSPTSVDHAVDQSHPWTLSPVPAKNRPSQLCRLCRLDRLYGRLFSRILATKSKSILSPVMQSDKMDRISDKVTTNKWENGQQRKQ